MGGVNWTNFVNLLFVIQYGGENGCDNSEIQVSHDSGATEILCIFSDLS